MVRADDDALLPGCEGCCPCLADQAQYALERVGVAGELGCGHGVAQPGPVPVSVQVSSPRSAGVQSGAWGRPAGWWQMGQLSGMSGPWSGQAGQAVRVLVQQQRGGWLCWIVTVCRLDSSGYPQVVDLLCVAELGTDGLPLTLLYFPDTSRGP